MNHQPQSTAEVELEEAGGHDVETHHRGQGPAVAVHVAGEAVRSHVGRGNDGLLTGLAVGLEADGQLDHRGLPRLGEEGESTSPAAPIVVVFADRVEVVQVVEVKLEDAAFVAALVVLLEPSDLVTGLLGLVIDRLEIRFGGGALTGDDGDADRVRATGQGDHDRSAPEGAGRDGPEASEGAAVVFGSRVVGGQLADRSARAARIGGVADLGTDVVKALLGIPGHGIGTLHLQVGLGAFLDRDGHRTGRRLGNLDVGRGTLHAESGERAGLHSVGRLEIPLLAGSGLSQGRGGRDEGDDGSSESDGEVADGLHGSSPEVARGRGCCHCPGRGRSRVPVGLFCRLF